MKKLCEITDVIPVRVFPNQSKKMGPIKPMQMDNSLIFSILNNYPAPKHFYAIDPNNRNRKVLLTRQNYNKTTEELFGMVEKEETSAIEVEVSHVSEPITNIELKAAVSVEKEVEEYTEVDSPKSFDTEAVEVTENSESVDLNLEPVNDTDDTEKNIPDTYVTVADGEADLNVDISIDSTEESKDVNSTTEEGTDYVPNDRPNYQNNKKKNKKYR